MKVLQHFNGRDIMKVLQHFNGRDIMKVLHHVSYRVCLVVMLSHTLASQLYILKKLMTFKIAEENY